MTNVPQPSWTAAGFQAPTGPEILAGVQADINAAFGGGMSFGPSTPQGQLAASLAAIIENVYATLVYYTNQVNPSYASGRMQDAIAAIYFLQRDASEPTALTVTCNGLPGVTIPEGAIVSDASGNLYQSTGSGVIGVAGTVDVPFACTVPGPTAVPASLTIYQAITGWDSASVASGVVGTDTETRTELELRREETVAGNSMGPIGAIIGAVAEVPGVLDYYGYNNNTAAPVVIDGVSIAAHAIYICVAGGTDDDIAQAILTKKGAGAPMTGSTSVVTYDGNPLYAAPIPYTIKFQRPTDVQITFKVVLVNGSNVPADAQTQVRAAIQAAFAGDDGGPKARIGSQIYATRFVAPLAALGSWVVISSIKVGSNDTPAAVVTASIAGTTMTVSAVSSGALAANQSLFNAGGTIADGTIIVAQLTGTPGGTGTYQLSISQTVGSGTVNAVIGDQDVVDVEADEIPQLTAANIIVSVV